MSPKKIRLPRLNQVMARLKPVAVRVRPFARKTGKVAKERVHRGRAWAAPKVERSGHVLQDTVAPKVSSLLTSAAHLIEPDAPGGNGQARSEADTADTADTEAEARS